MATGILLLLLGAFVVLRTVAPGQDRNLVDLILGKPSSGGAAPATSSPTETPTGRARTPAEAVPVVGDAASPTPAQDADPHALPELPENVPGYRGRI